MSSCTATTRERGRSTATFSRTLNRITACSGWSPFSWFRSRAMELASHYDSATRHVHGLSSSPGGGLQRLLRIPLLAKLAGANLVVVLATWAAVYATHRTSDAEWRTLALPAVVLVVGLVVNLVLVAVALRPIRDLERTAMRIWAGDLETRVPDSSVSDA